MSEIELTAPDGCTPIENQLFHLRERTFLVGPHADDSIVKLRWFKRASDEMLIGKVWYGPGAQGPPGHAHGGSLAAVMDEALGSACWAAGHAVVAAELNTSFKEMVPLNRTYTVEAWIDRVDGRKIYTAGHIIDDARTIYTTATGLFITLTLEKFQGITGDESPG